MKLLSSSTTLARYYQGRASRETAHNRFVHLCGTLRYFAFNINRALDTAAVHNFTIQVNVLRPRTLRLVVHWNVDIRGADWPVMLWSRFRRDFNN